MQSITDRPQIIDFCHVMQFGTENKDVSANVRTHTLVCAFKLMNGNDEKVCKKYVSEVLIPKLDGKIF